MSQFQSSIAEDAILFGFLCTSCLFTSYFTNCKCLLACSGSLEEWEVNKKAEETQDFSVLPVSSSTAWTEDN